MSNVHCWIHQPEEIRNLELLGKFSAFPNESFLRFTKRGITSLHTVAETVYRRLNENAVDPKLLTPFKDLDDTMTARIRSIP